MTMQTRLADLITAIGTDYKQLRTWITGSSTGDLTGLTTTAKTSIVAAINEVKAGNAGSPPAASTTVAGVTELATDAEALAMASTAVAVTPSNFVAMVNVANGLAKLDGTGKVAAAQLPSYVDDVLEYANQAAFPGSGASGVIYVAADTNKTFRWTGTVYVEISASPGTTDSLTEGATNLYYTATRADGRITALVGNTDTDLVALYTTAKA